MNKKINNNLAKVIISLIVCVFSLNTIMPSLSWAQSVSSQSFSLPQAGSMLALSDSFRPTVIKGLKIYPENPFKFDFIVDTQDSGLLGKDLQEESNNLIKYFLTTLTVPNKDLWVNLSPYEKGRIMTEGFGTTQMGRDLLAQDYLLKQITSSLMYPEEAIGEKFWEKIYATALAKYNTTDIPIDTFNKVWIVPEKAVIYQNAEQNTVYVVEAKLKVMLEEDYRAMQDARSKTLDEKDHPSSVAMLTGRQVSHLTSDVIKQVILPALEKEVNEGSHFALLRQIYHSMILAAWYKRNLKESVLSKAYVGKNKVLGVDIADKEMKQKIYDQYLKAFQVGVYNYIKEEYDSGTQSVIPRKYFSGGVAVMDVESVIEKTDDFAIVSETGRDHNFVVSADIIPKGEDVINKIEPREDNAMRVSTEENPLRLLPAMPGLKDVLNQPVFPDQFDRDLMSYLDDEVTLPNGVEIALNWIGINDGIRIDFIPREDFEDLKAIINKRRGQEEGKHPLQESFYKHEEIGQTIYLLPEDINVGEMRSLIQEINSWVKEDGSKSLKLTEETTKRFQNMAIFLAKQTIIDKIPNQQIQDQYRKHVELLYYLGQILKNDIDNKTFLYEDIKKMAIHFDDEQALSDFIDKLMHFLNLSDYKLKDADSMTWWTKKAGTYIQKMFALAIREKFEYVIFKKGIEELTHIGTQKSRLNAETGQVNGEDELLWSKLPFDQWKKMLDTKNVAQEEAIIHQIQEYVTQYEGWTDSHDIDYSPYYAKVSQELNCLGRSSLIARILKQIGFNEDRIYLGSLHEHSFIIIELADGTYFSVQTYRDPLETTKLIPEEILPRYYLANALAQKRSVFMPVDRKKVSKESPISDSFTAHRITEGLMTSILGNLLWDIYDRRVKSHPENTLELLDFVISGFQKILLFERNDFDAHENLALAYKMKSDEKYRRVKSLSDLKDVILLIEQAIVYQEDVVRFSPESKDRADNLTVLKVLRDEYYSELAEKEKAYAVNVSFIDEELKKVSGLDDSQREQFRQYLIDHGLFKYENLIRLFNKQTIEFLLDDPSVKPVFLEVLTEVHREKIVPFDQEGLRQVGNNSAEQGMQRLNDLVSFRVGLPQEADYLLTLDKNTKMVVGIASNTVAMAKRMNPHGRQSFILLEDGTMLGLKGSGQNLDQEAPSIEWDNAKDRYSGIMSLWEAQNAANSLQNFKGTKARLMQYLGYARIHAIPERNGRTESVDDILYEGKTLYKPAVAIYRVATPHRLSELRRLLSLDPDLRKTRKNISKALVSLGRLPQGKELSGEEFITNMMQGFGETEGYKQNKGWIKETFHQQDLLLSGDESDNEEFVKNEDPVLQLKQLRQKVIALSTMVSSIRMQEERTNQKTSLLPEKDSAYLALKTLMSSYFSVLEKKHLELWTHKEYKKEEVNPWDIVFSGFAPERFYVEPTSVTSKEMMDKKLFKDIKKWAQEALSEKDQINQDYAQVASPEIHRFFHATNIHDLVRMMRIGKIPAQKNENEGKRVYLNGEYAQSPGYFGNIIFYIDREGLDEEGITIYKIAGTPYFESREDIPLDRISNIENSRVMGDPFLILHIDREAERVGVQNEPVFIKSREIMLNLVFPNLTSEQRLERLASFKKSKEQTMEDITNKLPSDVAIVGLNFTVSKKQLTDLMETGHVYYLSGQFYLSEETDELRELNKEQELKEFISSDNHIFKKELSKFTLLTPETFMQSFIRYFLQDKETSLSEDEITRIIQFAKGLKDTGIYNKVSIATTLSELRYALMKKNDFPFVAYDAAFNAQRILTARGFKARLIESRNKEDRSLYYFVEVELLGKTLIIDLAADQFEIAKEADPAKLIFKPEYREMGIVILPQELVEKKEYKDFVPMYTSWERREIETDHAIATDKTNERVGGIDFNPNQLEIESQGGPIQFDNDLILENMDKIKGFSPVIFQIVPVTNLPLLLGVKEKEKKESVEKIAGV